MLGRWVAADRDAAYAMLTVGAVLTSVYMTRMMWYTFHGENRTGPGERGELHESGGDERSGIFAEKQVRFNLRYRGDLAITPLILRVAAGTVSVPSPLNRIISTMAFGCGPVDGML